MVEPITIYGFIALFWLVAFVPRAMSDTTFSGWDKVGLVIIVSVLSLLWPIVLLFVVYDVHARPTSKALSG